MTYTVQLYCYPGGSTCFSGSPGSIDSRGSTAMCFQQLQVLTEPSIMKS